MITPFIFYQRLAQWPFKVARFCEGKTRGDSCRFKLSIGTICYVFIHYSTVHCYFFCKVGIFSPASDEAINMPSLLNRVSSFLALITHQIESLL